MDKDQQQPESSLNMPRTLISILLTIAIGYLLLVMFVYFYQRHLLFLPDLPGRELEITPQDIGLNHEDVRLITSDNVKLHGWWLPQTNPSGTILFFHGNAGNISHRLQTLQLFHQLGYQTLIIDYRGYGLSQGTPSEQGLYLDAERAWDYLRQQRKLPADQIIIAGRSLGAAVALYLASRHTPRALIMESAFTSVPDMAAIHYPWLPVRWLSRYQFNNQQRIDQVQCPLLLVHSRQDEITPYQHARELLQRAAEPKQLLTLEGGHNDAQFRDWQTYHSGLQAFLRHH